METRLFCLVASLLLSAGTGAMAQTAVNPNADRPTVSLLPSSAVGRWLHDSQGNVIGSVRSLTDDGRTAIIMVGSYFQAGSHVDTVQASSLVTVNGKVMLRNETVQALNTAFWWR